GQNEIPGGNGQSKPGGGDQPGGAQPGGDPADGPQTNGPQTSSPQTVVPQDTNSALKPGTSEPPSGNVERPINGAGQQAGGSAQISGAAHAGADQETAENRGNELSGAEVGRDGAVGEAGRTQAGGERPAGGPDLDCAKNAEVVLSKDMLDDQLKANPQSVTLLGDGIRVVIGSESLKQVDIAADEAFSACLERLDGNQFKVRFWAGQSEITEFRGADFSVDLRYEPQNKSGKPVCKGEDGQAVPVDYRDGRAHVSLKHTGVYAIEAGERTGAGGRLPRGAKGAAAVAVLAVSLSVLH
ncbi:MAG: hypothetical protein LUH04_15245, partial [Clostridium sp.]|nr:hypothetical protein [Clostridium sp.]